MSSEIDKLSDVYKNFGGNAPNSRTDPLTYRTMYYSRNGELNGDDPYKLGSYHGMATLTEYFTNLPDHTLKFQFFNTPNSDIYRTIFKKISLSEVTRTMKALAEPIYSGFVESNKDTDFMKICNKFYYELFFNEVIYVSYDFFKDPYEIEDSKEPDEIEYYKKIGGFDTWLKLSGKENDKDTRFMHLATGIIIKIPDWLDKLAPVKWTNYRAENFTTWFAYSIKWLVGNLKIESAHNLLLKRVHIHGTKNMNKQREDIEERLNCETTIMIHDANQMIDIIPKIFIDGNDLTALHLSIFNQLDRQSYELGRVSNTNPKGDRYSTGENYKDITGIAARQKAILNELQLFAMRAKELWGKDLNFAVNGIPQTEMIEEHQEEAGNPNNDKQPDATTAISPTGK